jgi:hypothetical protein
MHKVGWAPEAVWMTRRNNNSWPKSESNSDPSVIQLLHWITHSYWRNNAHHNRSVLPPLIHGLGPTGSHKIQIRYVLQGGAIDESWVAVRPPETLSCPRGCQFIVDVHLSRASFVMGLASVGVEQILPVIVVDTRATVEMRDRPFVTITGIRSPHASRGSAAVAYLKQRSKQQDSGNHKQTQVHCDKHTQAWAPRLVNEPGQTPMRHIPTLMFILVLCNQSIIFRYNVKHYYLWVEKPSLIVYITKPSGLSPKTNYTEWPSLVGVSANVCV